MKALNSSEVESVANVLEDCVGYRLQEVESLRNGCLLRLYGQGRSIWWLAEMEAARPILLPFNERPRVSKSSKPLGLFINAHLVGRTLEKIENVTARVLRVSFSESATVEFRLFPHGGNILVQAGQKSISWSKPVPLKSADHVDQEARSIAELIREWSALRPAAKKTPALKESMGSSLDKKKAALEKLRTEIAKKGDEQWQKTGEYLKASQTMKIPAEFDGYVDFKKTLAENIQLCFKKAKDLERKIVASRARERVLENEIQKLEVARQAMTDVDLNSSTTAAEPPSPSKALAIKSDKMKLRKLELASGQLAYMGKSAADNLLLLRGAQPWDLWLHMKDYPGAHVIIRRPRGQETSPLEVEKAARWLASESPQAKRELRSGDRFEIQISEVRFVKPLKGDRLGRVTVAKPQVLRFRL